MMEKSKDELIRENKALRSFGKMITHDLKTPVVGLKMLADLLQESQDPEHLKEISREIIAGARDFRMRIDEYEKLFNQVYLEEETPENINIHDIFNRIIQRIAPQIRVNQAKIELNIPTEAKLFAVEREVESIVQNLLSNALKYRHPDRAPHIIIQAQQDDKFFCFSIKDNGIGINMDKFGARLFGKFQKFTDHPESVGMGLYIVKTLVEKNSGHIDVNAELDKGSIFSVFLPKEKNT